MPIFYIPSPKDGELIGMSNLLVKDDALVMNRLTGILPGYRKMGLALALKAHGIDYAISRGFQRMLTTNDSSNLAMISTNRRMGYEVERTWISLLKTRKRDEP